MYQRTTLTIARILENLPISEVQIILTPTWVGILGWVTTIGFYGSLVLIWLQLGILWAVLGFIVSHLLGAVIPIPSAYFYGLVIKHLQSEVKRNKNLEKREVYKAFLSSVEKIKNTYKVG